MHYVAVGLSHKTAPLDLREKLAIPLDKMGESLGRLVSGEEIREAMLISTCNRVEAYLVAKHVEQGTGAAHQFFQERSGLRLQEIRPCLYTKQEEEAITHLFRVTSSLDSMVVGEPQISAQVKAAYALAVQSRTTGAYLNKLVHRALHVAKEVRSRTAIGRLPVSVSYAAVVLAARIFDDLPDKQVLVLGAGEMAELTLRHLRERGVSRMLVSNRTKEKAERLATAYEAEVVPLAGVGDALNEMDIIISSIELVEPLITEEIVRSAMARRRGRPMFFIDLGVPRNVGSSVNRVENVYLYNVDDLQGIVEANRLERKKETVRAEGIIREEVVRFQGLVREIEFAPTIRDLSKKFDRIRREELNRFLARYPDLPREARESLEACTSAVVQKILHDPILLMKTEEGRDGHPRYSEILKKMFRLEE